ncbi:DUF4233 domain-containing protein [Corynebacterium uberis]|uniref:DUF4233 domain-containing protein n=1 Tax=Corynebacterium TaxID=1716 RepID=UPI001D0A9BDD|nr:MULTISPECIES: DUF4233 domain-containing protein [Corynebacterium]MCZ9310063.1 DUF4233 domain-containing protein [Corynebacterium sp. c6VSa_13]UDL73810.1 DUF4233 domain-containing protein [Corynebacterium uberis]UDL75307.1 DUF4233 domain-containing protein [Corynebacterium uberis]UDL77518.1 DUF4233 domain-containing protein [Corynebacterium uberis]UDL79805.1 DUF4233 domain-containing protein [Corynebacterium uberis]
MTDQSAPVGDTPEMGPLGAGHKPVKDPMRGLVGVMAATLSMEAITFYLVLTVLARIDDGAHWTTFNWVYVTVLATCMLVLSFLQSRPWALPLTMILQVAALGGFFIHYSMGVVALVFAVVWWYVLHLRSSLIARMKRGLLTTQHL